MRIYTAYQLSRMLKTDLRNHLTSLGYEEDISSLKKSELMNLIQYETAPYINYRKHCNDVINKSDENLIGEQKNVCRSIMSFMLGYVEKSKILKQLDHTFIPDIANIIVSKLEYTDYPKTNERLGLLLGGAGTGKTHLVSNIISKIASITQERNGDDDNINNMEIQVLAPTNKAIKVIKGKIRKSLDENKLLPVNIHFWTISKFLQQDIEYTPEGRVTYKTKLDINKTGYKYIKYVIIDEASMISRNNWNDLKKFIFQRLPKIKILLIGDDCQLPPVKEKSSVVFNIRCKRFRLNDIVRTQSEQITDIYNTYRTAVEERKKVVEIKEKGDDFKYMKSFKLSIQNEFDVINDKVISYSNDSVDKYNNLVRNIVFNNPEEKYVVGEKLIFGTSVRCSSINGSVVEAKHYYYANDEATVNAVDKMVINTNFTHSEEKFNLAKLFPEETFNVYKLALRLEDGVTNLVLKVVDEDIDKFEMYFDDIYEKIKDLSKNKRLKRDYISKLWNIFYTVKNSINIPIKYSYALTVYKAQGSTFQKVFIDLEDVHDCVKYLDVLNKTLYTAVTRASEKIRCYKPTLSDYRLKDIEQFPYLRRYTVLDHSRVYAVLKDGQNIIYTRNQYQSKNVRKIVRGRVVHILHKIIHVGNSNFTWELKLKDDIIIYI